MSDLGLIKADPAASRGSYPGGTRAQGGRQDPSPRSMGAVKALPLASPSDACARQHCRAACLDREARGLGKRWGQVSTWASSQWSFSEERLTAQRRVFPEEAPRPPDGSSVRRYGSKPHTAWPGPHAHFMLGKALQPAPICLSQEASFLQRLSPAQDRPREPGFPWLQTPAVDLFPPADCKQKGVAPRGLHQGPPTPHGETSPVIKNE